VKSQVGFCRIFGKCGSVRKQLITGEPCEHRQHNRAVRFVLEMKDEVQLIPPPYSRQYLAWLTTDSRTRVVDAAAVGSPVAACANTRQTVNHLNLIIVAPE